MKVNSAKMTGTNRLKSLLPICSRAMLLRLKS